MKFVGLAITKKYLSIKYKSNTNPLNHLVRRRRNKDICKANMNE